MFSLIALAPLALCMRPNKATLAAALGAFLTIVLPWICYQKFYEPPGNRLLKWHIAGVIPIDDRGVFETLYTSYHEISWASILYNKKANLEILFEKAPWCSFDLSPAHAGVNRAAELFYFFRGLGLGSWLLLLLPWLAWRLRGDNAALKLQRAPVLLAGWAMLTLVIWILLMLDQEQPSSIKVRWCLCSYFGPCR